MNKSEQEKIESRKAANGYFVTYAFVALMGFVGVATKGSWHWLELYYPVASLFCLGCGWLCELGARGVFDDAK